MDQDNGDPDERPVPLAFRDWLHEHEEDRGFRSNEDRPYRPPIPGPVYPEFDAADIDSLRFSLDGSRDNSKYDDWKSRLRRRAWRVWVRRSVPLIAVFGSLAMAGLVIQLDSDGHIREAELFLGFAIDRTLIFAVAMAIPIVVFFVYIYRALTSPLERFFRLMAAAERESRGWYRGHRNFVRCMNLIGRAARMLFRYQQQSRRTWLAPPAVADIALRVVLPLINIDVRRVDATGKGMSLRDIRLFLRDVSYLVVVEREDLIADLRSRYTDIVRRHGDGEESESDVKYLDPMRSKTRWDVRKDFYYPLSAWFSAVVAIVALVIGVLK
jgi:hypothetical protein